MHRIIYSAPTSNIIHMHDPQMGHAHIAVTIGITGSQHPGPISISYLLIAPDGTELARESMETGINGTCHEAEYLAIMLLSRVVRSRFGSIKSLSILSSDQLVVHQLTGRWRIRVDRFQTYVDKIHLSLKDIEWGIAWIPRVGNQLKDSHWERYQENDKAAGL